MNERSLGKTIQWARKRAGMTQMELAAAVGMPQPSIARIERGTVLPRTSTLIAILRATGHELAVEPQGPPADRELIRRRLARNSTWRTRDALGRIGKDPTTSPTQILRKLNLRSVPYVLVGSLAEAALGVPLKVGRTIEVVHATTAAAERRLKGALEDLGATSSNTQRMKTDVGWLHLLTETAAGDGYEMLIRNAAHVPIDPGMLSWVAAAEDLIRARRAGGTPEDLAVAAGLAAAAEEAMTIPRLPSLLEENAYRAKRKR
jgi:transcriptional regulator with XRE-family HTH domain